MYGLEQRGEKGDGDFRPGDGGGYVAPKKADYSHLLSRGDSDLQMLLFETFGGWSMPVVRLFNKMRDKVRGTSCPRSSTMTRLAGRLARGRH